MGLRGGWVPGGSVELAPAWWRPAIALVLGLVMFAAGTTMLAVGLTGWQVIDSGSWFGNLETRFFAVVVGLPLVLGGGLPAWAAARVRRHSRIVVSGEGIELVAPRVPDRSVRVPWAAMATVGFDGSGGEGGAAAVLPGQASLQITLRSRPSDDVVLELLESEPGRIDYRLDGFDIPAVRRTVNGFALRHHDPAR